MAESTRRTRPSRAKTAPKVTDPEPSGSPSEDLSPPTPTKRTPADKKLAASIAGTYQAIGMGIIGIGMARNDGGLAGTGTATVNNAEQIAEAWLDLADKNPSVKKALKKFTEISATGTLVGLHITLLIPLLIDRQVIPEPMADMAMGFAAGATNGNGNVN